MSKYIPDSYLYRAIGADIEGRCGRCAQSRSDCMCHGLSRMDICGILEDAATSDVVEVKRGKWKPFDLTWGRSIYYCTACEQAESVPTENGKPVFAYCPSCGAKMEDE